MKDSGQRYEAFGVPFEIRVNGTLSNDLLDLALPPGAQPTELSPVTTVLVDAHTGHIEAGDAVHEYADEVILAEGLERQIAELVALTSPLGVFIHAGAVGTPNGAIVVPGRSFTGKTTFVAAALKAGLTYYSDEYAILRPDGTLLPYPRRLWLRRPSGRIRVSASDLGATTAQRAAHVSLIINVPFKAGVPTRLASLPPERAALHLIDNAVAALARPDEVLRICARVARTASALAGTHEGAEALVAELLQQTR